MVTLFNITFSSGRSILYVDVYNVNFAVEALSESGGAYWYRGVKRR